MRDAPWKTLVRELTAAGCSSPYLDRLRERVDVAHAQASLETEIVREMAAAIGRADDKVNVALLRLELATRAWTDAREPEARRRCAREVNARRAEALGARWELLVHREAVGMRRHDLVERLYPIPPPVRDQE
jgi:hypothetical protein